MKKSFIVSFVISFIVVAILLTLVQFMLLKACSISPVDKIATLLTNLAIFVCLAYLYISTLTIGAVSVRIKVLSLFCHTEKLSQEDLLSQYNSQTIIDLRKNRLLRNGQLVLKDGQLFLGKKRQIYLAKFYLFCRRIILGTEKAL